MSYISRFVEQTDGERVSRARAFPSVQSRIRSSRIVEKPRVYVNFETIRSIAYLTRTRSRRVPRREAKCQSAFYSRVIEWRSHGTRTGSFLTTLLMRAGSYAKRITENDCPETRCNKLHDLRTSVPN